MSRFTWDSAKSDSNRRKHGISFKAATRVFGDPHALAWQERVVDGEERWLTIGYAGELLMLTVAHTVLVDEEIEMIRIISARRATREERRLYEEENR